MSPGSWETVRLRDVCKIDKKQDDHTDLPYVGMEHIESQTGRFIGSLQPQSVKSKTFRFGSQHLLYGRLRPYLNKVIAPDFEGHCATEIFPLLPGEKLDRHYLHYWLMQDATVVKIDATCTGARMPRANMNEVMEFELPLPPLSEQRRIVSVLDAAFAGLATAEANTRQNLTNCRELFDSVLRLRLETIASQQATQTLTDITLGIIDCEHKTAPRAEDGYPSIRTPNIGKGRLLLDGVYRVTKETYDVWTRRAIPKPGDLILAREAPAGNVGVIPDHEAVCLGQRTVLIQPDNNQVDSQFLAFLMLHPVMQERLLHKQTGATVQHVNVRDIRALAIGPLPELQEQRNLAEGLLEVQRLEADVEAQQLNKLAALEELKQSLLHRAFRGELTTTASETSATLTADEGPGPFPFRVPGISANDLHAGIIALAYENHEADECTDLLKHVKAEKIAHMAEAHVGLELDRKPVRGAAGPVDMSKRREVDRHARESNCFEFVEDAYGYCLVKLDGFDELKRRTLEALGDHYGELEDLLDKMTPLTGRQTEVLATVYAAWNNLLIDGAVNPSEPEIVQAARQDWHIKKLDIPAGEFYTELHRLNDYGLVPLGRGKYVHALGGTL